MESSAIPVVENLTAAEFKKEYLKKQKPVVLKGMARQYPAGEKWTMDYIKQVCGDVMVDVYDNSKKNSGSAYTQPDLKMPFREYIEKIVHDERCSLRMFLFNMFKSRPELRKDFPCPDIFKGILGRIGFMFFGAKGIKVRIHQDIDMSNVLLTQFYGRKKVVLVSPEYSELLYRLPFNTYSLVDLDNPDYQKFPALKYVKTLECVLEPGDALFMPSGYWHYITYLDGGYSVSYRKMAIQPKMLLAGISYFALFLPFDKVMNKLLGEKWLYKKMEMAYQRAQKAMNRVKPPRQESFRVNLQPR